MNLEYIADHVGYKDFHKIAFNKKQIIPEEEKEEPEEDIFGFHINDRDIVEEFQIQRADRIVRRPQPAPRMPRSRPQYADYGEESDSDMGFGLFD